MSVARFALPYSPNQRIDELQTKDNSNVFVFQEEKLSFIAA